MKTSVQKYFNLGVALIVLSAPACARAATEPVCTDEYGTGEAQVVQAMATGTQADVLAAIRQTQSSRGASLGCQVTTTPPTLTPFPAAQAPTMAEVQALWDKSYKPVFSELSVSCPDIGRHRGALALGAYYANLAGDANPVSPSILQNIAAMYENQQYDPANAAVPLTLPAGAYGMYNSLTTGDPCALPATEAGGTTALCANYPQACLTFNQGLFAGKNFVVADELPAQNLYDGSLDYDLGWAAVMMIEGAIQQTGPATKEDMFASAELAAQWAMTEAPVNNHNYTSKLIWLLSEMYDLTGQTSYMNNLIDKLHRGLEPGVLMPNETVPTQINGLIPAIDFSSLTNPVARVPGRMWDGHNSQPCYQAINTYAMIEAYVAFRDRGNTAMAQEVRPYMMTMLDNLANEVNTVGVVQQGPMLKDVSYAIMLGIWKVEKYEGLSEPEWEQAAWSIWQSGYFQTVDYYPTVPLYMLVLSNTKYQPLSVRMPVLPKVQAPSAPASLKGTAVSSSQINLSWGPSTDSIGVTGYYIYRDNTRVGTTATLSFSDTGLHAGTTYVYDVVAYDPLGNISGSTAELSVRTQSGGPNGKYKSVWSSNPVAL